ncbi:ATP-grasp domain-containing protein [Flavobacterium chilense]|uniref:Carbamoyl-phosphate synthase large subunit n=1 Tax=Flavobacterium chilense TaxID=946677 RepID=A0A1M7GSV3_9FLAO|nr:ATP-grasp domain-containing protein [Flavobacterium chilense]SHM19336.1 carbamoyl-phosphate synthase large subunit [Flavobacterium chilense]
MEEKTVLVTGIGGNVGQGILRNIKSLNLNIRLIGVDVSSFTPGNHLCDKTYVVPYYYDESYISIISKIIDSENVALVLPSTDYEVYHLSMNRDKLNACVVASDVITAKTYLDKYETYLYLSKHNIPFSKSWLVGEYDFSEKDIIAKPREGRGSRGILINPENPNNLPDGYMIQPLSKGKEITTAVYVNKNQKLHGLFTMERKLTNGTTTESKVIFKHDDRLRKIAQSMIDLGGLKGSFNIQSIVTEQNEIIPFEVNCRISGTNSIRHNLGFQDVKYAIQEYLFDKEPDTPKPIEGIATRILMDVIYQNCSDFESLDSSNYFLF